MTSTPITSPRAKVLHAYEHMMREQVAPALGELGFTGTRRTFKYRPERGGAAGIVQWQKDARAVHAGELSFTANVDYLYGAGPIAELMPANQADLWWEVRAGRPTARVAASVVTAVRRYVLPAILAAFEDLDPEPDRRASFMALFGARPDDDGGGVDPSAWFVQPRGTDLDDDFKDLMSGSPGTRSSAVAAVATAQRDPRKLPALLDRLRRDPEPAIRKVIATRMLAAQARSPQVRAALEATATDDGDPGIRWAARYALRLSLAH